MVNHSVLRVLASLCSKAVPSPVADWGTPRPLSCKWRSPECRPPRDGTEHASTSRPSDRRGYDRQDRHGHDGRRTPSSRESDWEGGAPPSRRRPGEAEWEMTPRREGRVVRRSMRCRAVSLRAACSDLLHQANKLSGMSFMHQSCHLYCLVGVIMMHQGISSP